MVYAVEVLPLFRDLENEPESSDGTPQSELHYVLLIVLPCFSLTTVIPREIRDRSVFVRSKSFSPDNDCGVDGVNPLVRSSAPSYRLTAGLEQRLHLATYENNACACCSSQGCVQILRRGGLCPWDRAAAWLRKLFGGSGQSHTGRWQHAVQTDALALHGTGPASRCYPSCLEELVSDHGRIPKVRASGEFPLTCTHNTLPAFALSC
jgi:hypothetical protein